MAVPEFPFGDRLVLKPEGSLLIGGSAEALEERVQTLLSAGHRHLVIDLENVPHVDSSGIRAIVRGYTTAERDGGSLTLVHVSPHVRHLLHLTRLDTILTLVDSLDIGPPAPGSTR
ncbi:MAG: STAS domain-containing protein [Acidobacteria bacterium]|nr:STAS domain-containing protein [Acidobacteriota bacterium]